MLKVVCVVDKKDTAIDRLAKGLVKYNTNLDYVICDVHPKRPSPDQIRRFEAAARNADIIDFQYFRTAEMLKSRYEELKDKKQILTHHNPYSIEEQDWAGYDAVVGNNRSIVARLKEITGRDIEQIPLTINTDFWAFNRDWLFDGKVNANNGYEFKGKDVTPAVIMVANRIESKKGILPVAIACGDLGVKFILVGAISDVNYFNAVMETGNVEFHNQITDEELRDLYYKSTIHVCNSVDNFESGTLPILEAMNCGVPVLTRLIGHVPELNNGENMVIYEGDNEDVIAITDKLREMLDDKKKLQELRDKGWQTAKNRSDERRAYAYQQLYRKVLYDTPPVSVIVPVYSNPETIRSCLDAIANQTYKNIELIVPDDSGDNKEVIDNFAKFVSFPVRYIDNAQNDYGLARARNEAAIEATGDILVFCDQRMVMDENAIDIFVKNLQPRTWLYGNKGAKKDFVENFSCVDRREFINFGMFNERMNLYGGLSQETRNRARNQNIVTRYVEDAKAIPKGKSHNKGDKKAEIIKMKNRLSKMGLDM